MFSYYVNFMVSLLRPTNLLFVFNKLAATVFDTDKRSVFALPSWVMFSQE